MCEPGQTRSLCGGPEKIFSHARSGPPINGVDKAVLNVVGNNQEGDIEEFVNFIYTLYHCTHFYLKASNCNRARRLSKQTVQTHCVTSTFKKSCSCFRVSGARGCMTRHCVSHLALSCILVRSQVDSSKYVSSHLNMRLQWLLVTAPHFPALHANKHVHHICLKTKYIVVEEEEEIKTIQTESIPCRVAGKPNRPRCLTQSSISMGFSFPWII